MRRLAPALLAFLAACTMADPVAEPRIAPTDRVIAPILTTEQARDPHSYARPEIARVAHVALDLDLHFPAQRVDGIATLDIQAAPGAEEIILDTKKLEILSVTDAAGRPLQWNVGAADEHLGAPLTVRFGDARRIVISYRSGPDAAALQWLSPEQTLGGDHPYLFSQGQAILNRTWIPTQDSPGIRQTWEARVTAPEPLKVVMSAENLDPDGEPTAEPGRRIYRFSEPNPVAPYLIAIAAGDIEFRALGPRSGVWTEPEMLDRAAAELADTERMIDAAEALYGPYRWGRYDMIVLPPAFPFGGMENPRLTFLTPTMIAGDKSLVSLIAHELAHSWSGNLVTNAAWADFWLNEGFTSYFENRIMESLYGEKRAQQEEALSWAGLQAELDEFGRNSPKTRLHLDLEGQDPDAGMTSIAYDKGAVFLRTIEEIVGRARWDAYLRSWFDRHAFEPATSEMFLEDLRANLIRGDQALEQRLMLDQWVYGTGLPANAARPDPAAFAEVDVATQAFIAGGAVSAVPYESWTTAERLRFLNALPREMSQQRLAELDRAFGLTGTGNAEVLFAWLNLTLKNRYEPAVPAAERFLTSMGRRKFVSPLFETLVAQGEWGRAIAERIYAKARPTYHSVTQGTIDRIMGRNNG